MPLFDLHPKELPDELYGREKELSEFLQLVEAKRWVVVLGPRMVGKTSLVKAANSDLENAGFKPVYVNLWGINNIDGLVRALVRGMNSSRTLFERIKDAVKRVEGISVGLGGFSISAPRKSFSMAWDLLNVLGSEGGNCVIELDEVQELSPITKKLLQLLANIFNTYRNIIFVFTGSWFSSLKVLLEPGPTSPLFGRSPAKIHLQPFEEEEAKQFLEKGFKEYNIAIEKSQISEAVEKLGGIPGRLASYGNSITVRGQSHEIALKETIYEHLKIVSHELENYLQGKDRVAYLTALKTAIIGATWEDIRVAISTQRGFGVHDTEVHEILKDLRDAMLIWELKGMYTVMDPLVRTLLSGIPIYVRDAMIERPIIVSCKSTVDAVAKLMESSESSLVIVIDDNGKPFGVISKGDIVNRVVARNLLPRNVKAEQVVTTPLITIEPDEKIGQAISIMNRLHIDHLGVISEGSLIGIISRENVWRKTLDFDQFVIPGRCEKCKIWSETLIETDEGFLCKRCMEQMMSKFSLEKSARTKTSQTRGNRWKIFDEDDFREFIHDGPWNDLSLKAKLKLYQLRISGRTFEIIDTYDKKVGKRTFYLKCEGKKEPLQPMDYM
jgi:AAA+ ATPase superfamily predicted ATPase/CBS domain-containing protein